MTYYLLDQMFYQILSAILELHNPFSLINNANKFATLDSVHFP